MWARVSVSLPLRSRDRTQAEVIGAYQLAGRSGSAAFGRSTSLRKGLLLWGQRREVAVRKRRACSSAVYVHVARDVQGHRVQGSCDKW